MIRFKSIYALFNYLSKNPDALEITLNELQADITYLKEIIRNITNLTFLLNKYPDSDNIKMIKRRFLNEQALFNHIVNDSYDLEKIIELFPEEKITIARLAAKNIELLNGMISSEWQSYRLSKVFPQDIKTDYFVPYIKFYLELSQIKKRSTMPQFFHRLKTNSLESGFTELNDYKVPSLFILCINILKKNQDMMKSAKNIFNHDCINWELFNEYSNLIEIEQEQSHTIKNNAKFKNS